MLVENTISMGFNFRFEATADVIRRDRVLGVSSSKMSCLCRLDGRSTSRSVVESTISIITPRPRTGHIRSRRKACPRDGRESSLPNTAFIMLSEWTWKNLHKRVTTKISRFFLSATSRVKHSTNTHVTHTKCKRWELCHHRDTLTFILTVSWCQPILISMRKYHIGCMYIAGPR